MKNNVLIIILAYMNRYLWFVLMLFIDDMFLMGICFIVFGLYQYIGYKYKWKHIFCSYQNIYHKKMTPDRINWSKVKKSDIYGISIILGTLGILAIIVSVVDIK